ncbi:MAG: DUF4394 domain-containing protein [Paludisphaera borealis]|nr:DUF4394 domain-containing protein [Paludisphaera borealis]
MVYGLAGGAASLRAEAVVGLTTANSLVTFDSATPGAVSAAILITGVGAETILDIDRRPADGLLYGLGSAGNLYVINTTTGAATLNAALTGVTLDPSFRGIGIDFNPVTDRLRIVNDAGQNLRLTPGTGATTIDAPLHGADSGAVAVAYTNNIDTAVTTTPYYFGRDTPLAMYNSSSPNGGVLALVGPLGVGVFDREHVGFDISGLSGIAYASLANSNGSGSSLYTINLITGAASLIGEIGGSTMLRGIALDTSAAAVPEPTSIVLSGVGLVCVALAARRRRAPADRK